MEVTLRPTIDVDNTEEDEAVTKARAKRLAAVFPRLTLRDRALLNTFRYIQFRKLFLSPVVVKSEIERELLDPDPYEPMYVFYCMRLKGCSV